MRKRRFYLLWIAMALALAGVLVWALSPSEPRYNRKTLSEWVIAYGSYGRTYERIGSHVSDSRSPKTDEAIRQIGTSAVPYLIKWIRYQPPSWKREIFAAGNRLIPSWDWTDGAQVRAENSIDALIALAPGAGPAIPALADLLRRPMPSIAAIRAVTALRHQGAEGLPPLLNVLTNKPASSVFLKHLVLWEIGEAGTNAWAAAPILQQLLKEPAMEPLASNALRRICPQALKAAPHQ